MLTLIAIKRFVYKESLGRTSGVSLFRADT